jgi:hypothetical protein
MEITKAAKLTSRNTYAEFLNQQCCLLGNTLLFAQKQFTDFSGGVFGCFKQESINDNEV